MSHVFALFPDDVVVAAKFSHRRYYPRGPFISITLAQWAVESGYGKHMSGVNNPFGIKASLAQRAAGQARLIWTKEFIRGRYVPEEQWFANYLSIEDAFDHHAELLTSPHYQRCIDAKTPEEYAQALHLCNYANAPNYPEVLMHVIKNNELTLLDIPIQKQAIITNS